jgi:hypothetical protein
LTHEIRRPVLVRATDGISTSMDEKYNWEEGTVFWGELYHKSQIVKAYKEREREKIEMLIVPERNKLR